MPNVNGQTIAQMPGIVNKLVKQATGRESVSNINMDFVTVAQDRITEGHTEDYDDLISFVNNSVLPMTVKAKVQYIQTGTGDPSSENIRPFVGWTGCALCVTGKNMFSVPEVARSGWHRFVACPIRETGKYTFSLKSKVDASGTYGFAVYGTNVLDTSAGTELCSYSFGNTELTKTVTISATYKYLRITFRAAGGTLDKLVAAEFQIEKGETKTYYEAPGKTYIVDWTDEAGTVYGGELDITGGNLKVTYGHIASYNNEELPGVWVSDRDVYEAGTTPTEGAEVVYALATAESYDLTAVVVNSRKGQNNIAADTGDVTVSYTSYIPVP